MARKQSNSRQARWSRATGQAREALEALQTVRDEVNETLEEKIQGLVDELQDEIDQARDKLEPHVEKASEAMEQLRELQEEYQEWFDNMPDSLQYNSPVGEKLQEMQNFDFDIDLDVSLEVPNIEPVEVELDLDELESLIDEADGADLPLGFGRD